MQRQRGDLLRPAMLQAFGLGATAGRLWLMPAPMAARLPRSLFVIDSFRARHAIAVNVHVFRHQAASIGHAWRVLQAGQSAMNLVAPVVGGFVLDTLGSAALSFAVFLARRAAGMPRFQGSASA